MVSVDVTMTVKGTRERYTTDVHVAMVYIHHK